MKAASVNKKKHINKKDIALDEEEEYENEDNNEMEEELDNIIVLNDEEGKEVQFEFLDLVEYENEEYVVLLPIEEAEDDAGEVVILKVEDTESEDEESYVSVDDQETLNTVFEIFKEKFKDEFNFIDED
jgi:uncharacterized protein YrzB (UPF0473 family)